MGPQEEFCVVAIVSSLFGGGCFSPNQTPPNGATGDASDSGGTAASVASGNSETGSGGSLSTTGLPTSSSQSTSSTGSESSSGGGGSTDSTSTGPGFEPACDDGVSGPGEFCFEHAWSLEFSDFSVASAIGDINGDGSADIVSVIGDQLQFFLGDSEGGLSPFSKSTNFNASAAADICDLNADSALDVAFAGSADGKLYEVRAAFSEGVSHAVAEDFAATNAGVSALRCSGGLVDGGAGLVHLSSNGQTLDLRSVGSLGVGGVVDSVGIGTGASILTVADVNGDGLDDVVVGRTSSDGVLPSVQRVFGGAGGVFVGQQSLLPVLGVSGNGLTAIAVGDIDGDGLADLALAISNAIFVGFGDGLNGFLGTASIPVNAVVSSLVASDLDGDGSDELILAEAGPGPGGVRVLGEMGGLDAFYLAGEFEIGRVDVGDLNGDSVPDIVFHEVGGGLAEVVLSHP